MHLQTDTKQGFSTRVREKLIAPSRYENCLHIYGLETFTVLQTIKERLRATVSQCLPIHKFDAQHQRGKKRSDNSRTEYSVIFFFPHFKLLLNFSCQINQDTAFSKVYSLYLFKRIAWQCFLLLIQNYKEKNLNFVLVCIIPAYKIMFGSIKIITAKIIFC